MIDIGDTYVEARDGNIYVGKSRVTLRSVIGNWQRDASPEAIQTSFPTLSLASIYGAIAYYLAHHLGMDAFFHETEELFEARLAEAEAANPEWYARMRQRAAEARARLGLTSAEPSDEATQADNVTGAKPRSRVSRVKRESVFVSSLTRISIRLSSRGYGASSPPLTFKPL